MPRTAFPLPAALRRRRRLFVTAAVLALAALLATVTPMLTSAGPARFLGAHRILTVATWNMCGVRQWGCADTGSGDDKRRAVERLVDAGADVVLLQEACARHAESVREALGGTWQLSFQPYNWRDRSGRSGTVVCEGHDQGTAGLAVLSAHPLSSVRSVALLRPAVGVWRGILCATVEDVGIEVCNAHLSVPGSDRAHPEWEYRDDELRALIGAVPERHTVYGGDFNLNPPGARNRSTWVWPSAPYHVHRECDQASGSDRSGRPTHLSGHKLDYLFTGLPRYGCTVHDTGASDHRALLIRVSTG